MLPLSGLLGRICNALLNAVIALVVLLILGAIISHFDAAVGDIITKYAAIIALLVGLVTFFSGWSRNNTIV